MSTTLRFRLPLLAAAASALTALALFTHSALAQSAGNERILVSNSTQGSAYIAHQPSDITAQGFTTGGGFYKLTGVEVLINYLSHTENLSFSISKATGSGEPGETIYDLTYDVPTNQVLTRLSLAAPESATLEPNTQYFLHISGGLILLFHTSGKEENGSGLADWSVADNHLTNEDGGTWNASETHVYEITVKGEEIVIPDKAGDNAYTARRLPYSRAAGKSPFVSEFIGSATDVDWFKTGVLSFDAGARYRIDVKPVSLTDSEDLQVSAFHIDYPSDHSRDEFLTLEKLTSPQDGLISYYVRPTRHAGPYIEVSAANGTTGEYEIRIVYDPVMTWDGSEIQKGDLPHDDTTWASITVDDSTPVTGVYNYYDDHDWFEVELEADETYTIITIPPDSWLVEPDVGTVLSLYDSEGNQLEIDYSGSRLSSAQITYTVPMGEGGTFYIDVSYADFLDDPDVLAVLGMTEGFESGSSPFIGSRYKVTVSQQN